MSKQAMQAGQAGQAGAGGAPDERLAERLKEYRVLPVITVGDAEAALALCAALQRGGMRAVEITLRAPGALECIREVRAALPELAVAAGTVVDPETLQQAAAAGCDLCLSPGLTGRLLDAAREARVDLVPGAGSASDIMQGMDYGLNCFKLFPAAALGGVDMLRALAGPFPGARFCPTGGLGPGNFRDYLALPNVACCGGSWMAAPHLIESGRWDEVEALAAAAMAE